MVRSLSGLRHQSKLLRAGLGRWLLCVLILGAQGSAQESPAKSILHLVIIKTEMRGYRSVAAGTAFFISPTGTALTNSHVVDLVRHEDRKSTRLNSSHLVISYAVFCLKKKK